MSWLQKMIDQQIVKEFQTMFDKNLENILIPYKKGNSIRIGNFEIIEAPKQGVYKIKNLKNSKIIFSTFTKAAAFALAGSLTKTNSVNKKIPELDKIIEKNYLDCIFYKHSIQTTADHEKREATITRLEIASLKIKQARRHLERIIFSNITK